MDKAIEAEPGGPGRFRGRALIGLVILGLGAAFWAGRGGAPRAPGEPRDGGAPTSLGARGEEFEEFAGSGVEALSVHGAAPDPGRRLLPVAEPIHRGRAVDAVGGEALADVSLRLRIGGRLLATVTSDAEGDFVLPDSPRPDSIDFEAHDLRSGSPLEVLSTELLPRGSGAPDSSPSVLSGEPLHLRVALRVGPSYRVSPSPSLSDRDLRGRLVFELDRGERLRGPWTPLHRPSGNTLRFSSPFHEPRIPTAPVGDTVVWVSLDRTRSSRTWLELSTRDPRTSSAAGAGGRDFDAWSGRTPVQRVDGHGDELHPVHLRRQATFEGRVVDERGTAVEGARVSLIPLDGSTGMIDRWLAGRSEDGGRFQLPPTEPGDHQFTISAPNHSALSGPLELLPGSNPRGDFVLQRTNPPGSIAGSIALLGADVLDVDLRLHCVDRAYPDRVLGISLDAEEPLTFDFESVPHGRWQLSVHGVPGLGLTAIDGEAEDPACLIPPLRGQAFRVEVDRGVRPLVFDVRDVETGESVEDFELLLRSPGEPWLHAYGLSGTPDFEVVQGEPLDWILIAPGFRPRRGTESAFAPHADGLRATVELERGFGGAILLKDASRLLAGRHGTPDRRLLDRDPPGPPEFGEVVGLPVLGGDRPLGFSDDSGLLLLDDPPPFEFTSVGGGPWRLLLGLPARRAEYRGRIRVGYLLELP